MRLLCIIIPRKNERYYMSNNKTTNYTLCSTAKLYSISLNWVDSQWILETYLKIYTTRINFYYQISLFLFSILPGNHQRKLNLMYIYIRTYRQVYHISILCHLLPKFAVWNSNYNVFCQFVFYFMQQKNEKNVPCTHAYKILHTEFSCIE